MVSCIMAIYLYALCMTGVYSFMATFNSYDCTDTLKMSSRFVWLQ